MNIQKIANEIVFFIQKNEFSYKFFSFLESFNEKFKSKSWIEKCVMSHKEEVMREFFDLLDKTAFFKETEFKNIFSEIFHKNMHFDMLNILNCAQKIISLNEEIIVLHKHNIRENEKSDLVKNIQKIDYRLMNRDVKFKKKSDMNENLIIVVGTEMYSL